MEKIDGNFLLSNYKDISIQLSSELLPISLIEQIAYCLKKDHEQEKEVN